ncbi:MAG: hypothetical protein AMJ89_01920 [candidate division Zixibacteria bacterium SM23_73]|nr:MAG: hypothetical protein AMJ89_01920 [candidate division Zixibacteria bacterium SM23_73]
MNRPYRLHLRFLKKHQETWNGKQDNPRDLNEQSQHLTQVRCWLFQQTLRVDTPVKTILSVRNTNGKLSFEARPHPLSQTGLRLPISTWRLCHNVAVRFIAHKIWRRINPTATKYRMIILRNGFMTRSLVERGTKGGVR